MKRAKVLSRISTILWAVGRKRPPLCRGCAPATPPSKTIAHRPCLRIPTVPPHQPGCQPNTQSDSLNGGRDKGLVKTGTVYGLVVNILGSAARAGSRGHLTAAVRGYRTPAQRCPTGGTVRARLRGGLGWGREVRDADAPPFGTFRDSMRTSARHAEVIGKTWDSIHGGNQ